MTPSLGELFAVFGRIGLLSFGGPAAQIALMHRELVAARRWLSERQFLDALGFCMLLPGPEAMQLATFAGWRLRGLAGGLLAGLLFVLPGAAVMLALAWAYVTWGDVPAVRAAFAGVKAAVVVIVAQALVSLARRALRGPADRWLALLAFVAIFAFALPFPLIVALAAAWGALTAGLRGLPAPPPAGPPATGALRQLTLTVLAWGAIWFAPMVPVLLLDPPLLADLGLFFARLAVVTFGGAYAVLAYMTQEVVTAHGWLTTPEMIDGLGLAETTPGPLILVTEFVGFLAGHHAGGPGLALAAAALTLWMTFVPCFLWIFAGAPHLDRLAAHPHLGGALAGITAAVVGVVGNLSLWFFLHVAFAEVTLRALGPLRLAVPEAGSLQPGALAIAALAAVLVFRLRLGLAGVLAACAAAGLALAWATG